MGAKLGDILEIKTRRGLAYAQYTHQHPTMGGLLRVFEMLVERRPQSFSKVAAGPVRFSTFFPVRAAVGRGILTVVSNEQIAEHNSEYPIFRNGLPDPSTKKVSTWWFWDGKKEWKVGEITQEQRKLPILSVWNDTLLIERIEAGWTPSDDPA
ncbi:MAG: hypothetical protein HY925_02575 [Elusimicrobia bacterium]|nr:hypothetical protein [Elusimicrobiota bacterium]